MLNQNAVSVLQCPLSLRSSVAPELLEPTDFFTNNLKIELSGY